MSKQYRPKRATKKWLEGAPAYVRSCFDNKGKTVGRYTVTFCGDLWHPSKGRKVQYLGMSDNPDSPNGFSMFGECFAFYGPSHDKIKWLDLPEHIRQHVISRVEY